MQKKLIALAIAGLASTGALAQTNVTVYGIVDMGVANVKADGRSSGWKIDNGLLSGSRIGFKGEEDLGGGLKALFTVEYMLMPDVNAAFGAAGDWSGTATRQAFVGLKGNWGTVVAGRLQGAGYNFACSHNPVAGGAFDTISKLRVTAAGNAAAAGELTLGCGSNGRTNNSIAYISPNWNGFTVEYNHARLTENATRVFSTAATATFNLTGAAIGTDPAHGADDSYANLLRGNYTNGPFSASLVWAGVEGGKNNSATGLNLGAAQPADTKEWGIGADYDFGIAKIYGTYQDRDTDKTSLGAVSTANGDKYALGVSIPVFKVGSIMLSYADFDAEVKGWDADAWTLAYFHSLSKRTTLYGGYSSVSNDRLNGSTAAAASAAPRTGGDASMLAFGMRHTF
jgi:predicted porin